MITDYWLS